jgi:hypothetical protein
MNNLWYRDTPVSSSFDRHYEYNTSDKDYQINNTTTDRSGCPSRIHFGSTSYTLGFGHLFSGNLQYYQPFNPIGQSPESCSFKVPECYSNPSQMNNIKSQQHPVTNHKIDEAMETIRNAIKNVEKQYNYSIPSVPYRCNPVMNNCKQSNIDKAAALLERAANAISRL